MHIYIYIYLHTHRHMHIGIGVPYNTHTHIHAHIHIRIGVGIPYILYEILLYKFKYRNKMFVLPSVWLIPIDFGAEWTKFDEKCTKFGAVPNICFIFHLRLRMRVT